MGAVEYILNADGDKLEIDVPKDLQGKEVRVLVMEHRHERVKRFDEMPVEERLRVLETYRGTAKFPDVPFDKYDVYEQ